MLLLLLVAVVTMGVRDCRIRVCAILGRVWKIDRGEMRGGNVWRCAVFLRGWSCWLIVVVIVGIAVVVVGVVGEEDEGRW